MTVAGSSIPGESKRKERLMRIRRVALLAGIGSAAVALTLGVTLAGGGDGATADAAALTSYAAAVGSSDSGDQAGLRSQIGDLMADQAFRDDVRALRDTQQAAMDEWWDTYADEPTGSEAREAMRALREDARDDMKALLEEYDIALPGGLGGRLFGGRGAGLMGGDGLFGGGRGGGLMGDGPGLDTQESAATLSL
jgi:hypothetical protein